MIPPSNLYGSRGISLSAVSTRQLSFITVIRTFYIIEASPFIPLSYLILSLISFPTLPRRLDFPMQRYSGHPASSTAMLTARGFARQPSQIRDGLSVPRHVMPVGLGSP